VLQINNVSHYCRKIQQNKNKNKNKKNTKIAQKITVRLANCSASMFKETQYKTYGYHKPGLIEQSLSISSRI